MNNLKNQIQELQTPPSDKISLESFIKQEPTIPSNNIESKKLVVPIKIHSPPNARTPSSSVSSKSIPQSQKLSPHKNVSESKIKKEQTPTTFADDNLQLRRQKRENDRKNFRDFLKNQRQNKVLSTKTFSYIFANFYYYFRTLIFIPQMKMRLLVLLNFNNQINNHQLLPIILFRLKSKIHLHTI